MATVGKCAHCGHSKKIFKFKKLFQMTAVGTPPLLLLPKSRTYSKISGIQVTEVNKLPICGHHAVR